MTPKTYDTHCTTWYSDTIIKLNGSVSVMDPGWGGGGGTIHAPHTHLAFSPQHFNLRHFYVGPPAPFKNPVSTLGCHDWLAQKTACTMATSDI